MDYNFDEGILFSIITFVCPVSQNFLGQFFSLVLLLKVKSLWNMPFYYLNHSNKQKEDWLSNRISKYWIILHGKVWLEIIIFLKHGIDLENDKLLSLFQFCLKSWTFSLLNLKLNKSCPVGHFKVHRLGDKRACNGDFFQILIFFSTVSKECLEIVEVSVSE